MALFSKRNAVRENRIENFGRWPIRLTDFHLVSDYEFPPSPYTEIFLVRSGTFLHETENGTQAVRVGTAMVHHPSTRHMVKNPEGVRITRLRYLPEWLAGEYENVMGAPDVLGLFFAHTWFELPEESSLQVFTTRDSQSVYLSASFDFLSQCLRTGRHLESVSRVTLFEILLLLGDEYHVYWRGGNRLTLANEVRKSLDIIERAVASGNRLPLKQLQTATDLSQDGISQALRKGVGLSLIDYVQRRRLQHAARRLIGSADAVALVAEQFAFSDEQGFGKEFEKLFGFTPAVYREKFTSGNGDTPR